jgi:hypothetical protein
MKQDIVTIVCDKCGRSIRSRDMYGYSHQCSGRIREINEHFNKIISFASTQKEVREAREARAYANTIYSPMSGYRRPIDAYSPLRDYPRMLS